MLDQDNKIDSDIQKVSVVLIVFVAVLTWVLVRWFA